MPRTTLDGLLRTPDRPFPSPDGLAPPSGERPRTVAELTALVARAARHGMPLTVHGAGTAPPVPVRPGDPGEYLGGRLGGVLRPGGAGRPGVGGAGLVVDVRGVAGVLAVEPGRISLLPGTVLRVAEEAARATGQELALLPGSADVATASGFVCGGGPVALGSASHGALRDGNVLAVELLTREPTPRHVRLEGPDVLPVLGSHGRPGVLTRVELRLVPARSYTPVCAVFPSFDSCCRFAWSVATSDIPTRLLSLHRHPRTSLPLTSPDLCPDAPITLLLPDTNALPELAARAATHAGLLTPWPESPSHLPYSHPTLWPHPSTPRLPWLEGEYSPHQEPLFLAQLHSTTLRPCAPHFHHLELHRTPQKTLQTLTFPPHPPPTPLPLPDLKTTTTTSFNQTLHL
ncbi:hypothetical protein LO762_27690 [Actinocorallia sp. API 0066]|uniref:FAD-binding oxidoreductase n=1 Tax=Actinocorallia sp. API 0066 TaxID=2896846 RepID=UPI001E4936C3|nr:hypothetical protein [Actinocorallia sp. API 0066]MCD0452934.1 hypothetical protein [Actinocorallia sp. API 0066]